MSGERDEVVRVSAPPILAFADVVLLADADPAAHVWLRSAVAGRFVIDEVTSGTAALDRIAAGTARLVIIGNRLADMTGEALVTRAAQWLAAERRASMTFLLADDSGEHAEVGDQVQVFYRLVRG